MLEALVVLVVLEELVVLVGEIFETVKSQNFFWGKIIKSKKSYIALFPFDCIFHKYGCICLPCDWICTKYEWTCPKYDRICHKYE